jgi:hypothetical protein
VPLGKAPAEGAHDEVRRRDDRAHERHKGTERGDHEPDQDETRQEREDEQRPQNDEAGRPFESICKFHGSTTFLVRRIGHERMVPRRERCRIGQDASLGA